MKERAERKTSPWYKYVMLKFSDIKKGSRFINKYLKKMFDKMILLTPQEKVLMTEVLYNREKVLVWKFKKYRSVDPLITLLQIIPIIPHEAWQVKGILIPPELETVVVQLLKTRIKRSILEEFYTFYRNSWFLIKKKDGGLQLINSVI